jgi:hypothetical protein
MAIAVEARYATSQEAAVSTSAIRSMPAVWPSQSLPAVKKAIKQSGAAARLRAGLYALAGYYRSAESSDSLRLDGEVSQILKFDRSPLAG